MFSVVSALFRPVLLAAPATYAGIAVAHSAFNILCTLLLYPMSSLLEKLAYKIVPDGKEAEKAVEWITSEGIMLGNSAGDLMLDQPLTGKRFAVMLYRYHKKFHPT